MQGISQYMLGLYLILSLREQVLCHGPIPKLERLLTGETDFLGSLGRHYTIIK